MDYRVEWDFEDKHKRFWSGFGTGYTINKDKAKRFTSMKQAEIEAHNIHKSRKQGASIRPWE